MKTPDSEHCGRVVVGAQAFSCMSAGTPCGGGCCLIQNPLALVCYNQSVGSILLTVYSSHQ